MKVVNNADKIEKEFENQTKNILTAIGTKAVDIWKMIITDEGIVDTGRFRNSCTFEVGNKEVAVGTNVEYAQYLELGTSKRAARPSLKPAIMDYQEDYKNIAESMLKS